jgi:hypothetical protein
MVSCETETSTGAAAEAAAANVAAVAIKEEDPSAIALTPAEAFANTAAEFRANVAANVVLQKAAANKKAEVMSKIEKLEALIEENPEFREVIKGFMAVDEMEDRIYEGLMTMFRKFLLGLVYPTRLCSDP